MALTRKQASFKGFHKNAAAFNSAYETRIQEAITGCNEPTLKQSDIDTLVDAFKKVDSNCTGTVRLDQLPALAQEASMHAVTPPDLRRFAQENNMSKDITPAGFVKIYMHNKTAQAANDPGFRNNLSRVCSKKVIKSKQSSEALVPVTAFSVEETRGFSHWINSQLGSYLDSHGSRINEQDPYDLFNKMGDGIIACMMLQKVSDNLIDDRAINKKITHEIHKHENLNLAINTAAAIGCVITGQHSVFIMEGRPNMCLGLIWQIIRAGLFVNISLQANPYLARLLEDGETMEDLLKLSQEQLLLRWVNYQLKNNDNYEGEPIKNFSGDIKDSVAYQYLIEEIQPQNTGLVASPLSRNDLTDRAEDTLQMADRLGCREFVTPTDIVKGHQRLNLAFVANLYNNHPNLKPVENVEIQETREEKTYRNWMNSMGIKPQINYLYTDLQNGVALLKLEDIIQPGVVSWKRVNMPPYKAYGGLMKRTENCAYAVDLAPQLGVKVIGTRGHDITEGNKMLTLGIVWQLMRAYTLSLLTKLGDENGSKLTDKDIVNWFNSKTGQSINNFRSDKLQDATIFQTLLRTIDPEVEMETINASNSYQEKLANATYIINCARKMGAVVYTLPEDIVESKPKMVLCFVVTLMVLEKQMSQQHE